MIRTLIEVTSETAGDHERALKATLDQLGYEPKDDPEHIRYMRDFWRELADRGLDPREMVLSQRKKRGDHDTL